MGIPFWIFSVGPKCSHMCYYKREADGNLTLKRFYEDALMLALKMEQRATNQGL